MITHKLGRRRQRLPELDSASHSQPDRKPKTFVIGHDDDRPLLFTPTQYDSATGLLHGADQSERPMALPLARLLQAYEPTRLEWGDE